MSGTTRTVQQPLDTRNIIAVVGMAAVALAITVAIAWGSANLVRTVPAPLPAPAAISDPALRDIGARDLGAASVSIGTTYGAPGAYRPVTTSGGGSTLVKDDVAITTSGEGAPATRRVGFRAH